MALTDNLISVWELVEASGNALDSFGSNDLTDNATVGAAAGLIIGSRDFEANNSEYFQLASNTDLRPGDTDFTTAAWVRAESSSGMSGSGMIAGKWLTTGNQREYKLAFGGNGFGTTVRFELSASGTSTTTQKDWSGTLTTATWYHVVAWHDSVANLIGIAVNAATAETSSHSTGVYQGTGYFTLGGGSGGSLFYDGLIEQAAVWSRVLTSQERTDLYNGGAGLAYSSWSAATKAPLFRRRSTRFFRRAF